MNRSCCALLVFSIISIQLSAMQGQSALPAFIRLDPHCISLISQYLSHADCTHVRQTCRDCNKPSSWGSGPSWWSPAPIYLRADENTRDVPEELYWKALLAKIIVYENRITFCNPTIDRTLVDIPNAIILQLDRFRQLSYLPDELEKTSYIRAVDLSDTKMPVPEISKLPRLLPLLDALNLSGNGIQDVPQFLGQMKQLRSLNLSYNDMDCPQLADLPKLLPQLQELDVSFNRLSDLPLVSFKNFDKLLRFNVAGNYLYATYLTQNMKVNLPHLVELDIGLNHLTFDEIFHLAPYESLRFLNLDNDQQYSWLANTKFSPEEKGIIQRWLPQTTIIFPKKSQSLQYQRK